MSPQHILMLGASGSLARAVIPVLLAETDTRFSLYVRNAARLAALSSERVTVVEGDVLDTARLTAALAGQSLVYAGLAGNLQALARSTEAVMDAAGGRHLIWISSTGIYNETGENHGTILTPYKPSAAIVEVSDLDYTFTYLGGFTSNPAMNYQLTRNGEAFRGHQVSHRLANIISKMAQPPRAIARKVSASPRRDHVFVIAKTHRRTRGVRLA